ncbi:methyltransferase type 11 [Anaerosporomusa subterranea]|uniref:Methyltransferase type 11 n=1 Tax=Anaerosporomusa subterranea TaxID=1794912 RepID=A0A154BT27_ANASB|nr:class I SAM-dependent methyltransferase [Anaerosporomusa subterranea]KYZ77174.1 methyltransferase type 11 [Anaerosporomusa subterranea]
MNRELYDDNKTYSPVGTHQEVAFIVETLGIAPQAKILDLYCGYGRHAIELAKSGYLVTGVDGTQAFIDIARQKAIEAGVSICFEQKDMRELAYDNQFDAVINMFAAFGYFSDEENALVLKQIANALHSGGFLLMDLLNRELMARSNLNRYWRHPSGEYVLSYKAELQHGTAKMKREVINQNSGKKLRYEFDLRSYSLYEIETLLENSGLKIRSTFGNFDRTLYNHESPRLIVLAQKL